jgi:hypothetical protein
MRDLKSNPRIFESSYACQCVRGGRYAEPYGASLVPRHRAMTSLLDKITNEFGLCMDRP